MKQSKSSLRGCNKTSLRILSACALFLAAAVTVLGSCATTGARATAGKLPQDRHIEAALAAARSPEWVELSPGIWQASLPAALCGTELVALKIKLGMVSLTASQPAGKTKDGFFFTGEFAADFAIRTGATVAVNMTPFSKKGSKMYPAGIYINDGVLLSPPNEKYAAIFFFEDGGAAIASFQDERILPLAERVRFAFGGFWMILEHGELADFPNYRNSRTVLGLDSAGETLFVLSAVKASLFGSSTGISFTEGAVLIRALGADSAIQMDGGSSTCLAANGKQIVPSNKYFLLRKNKKTAVNAGFSSVTAR